jgi:hypothetical protein
MSSGIAGLKRKLVKNSSQRSWSLFIGAQKTAILASKLCKNGWEKGHTPFVKVVEGQEIYNFAIRCLDHFCSTLWRFARSKRATWKGFAGTGRSGTRRPRRRRASPASRSYRTRTPRPALARWSMRRGPPLRTAIRALSPVATRHARMGGVAPTAPLGQPRAAVRTPRRAPMMRPCRDHCGCRAHQGVVDHYKGAELSLWRADAFPPSGCSAAVRHWRPPPSVSLRLPPEQMHAPTLSLSHHWSCPGHLLLGMAMGARNPQTHGFLLH